MILALIVTAMLTQGTTLYLSDHGSDSNTGTSEAQAFGSLERLDSALKQIRAGGNQTLVSVEVSGTIFLPKTARLGTEASNVRFEGTGGFSGAARISGWKTDPSSSSRWVVTIPSGLQVRQLFSADGSVRDSRPKLPATGEYHFADLPNGGIRAAWDSHQDAAIFSGSDIQRWKNLSDVEVVAYSYWSESRLPIQSVDPSSHLVRFDRPSVWRLTNTDRSEGAPYVVENVFEALRSPGQFYWDRPASKLYYIPRPGESLGAFVAYAPQFPVLIQATNAKGLSFSGLTFEHTQFTLPAGVSGATQASWNVPAALTLTSCQDSSIARCTFQALGDYAVELFGPNTSNTTIKGCSMRDLGAGGVKLNHATTGTKIEDCTIEDGGKVYPSAVGIWIGDSGHNLVSHNRIAKMFYSGINVGWSWGYGPTTAQDNTVEFNDISDIGQGLLSDMGGIYTLGLSEGSILRNNLIHNVRSRTFGGWGIYFDAGTTGMLAENNVVFDAKTGGFHQDYGKSNTIRNNIFAFSPMTGQIILSKPESPNSFTFEHNIVEWSGTDLFAGAWENSNTVLGDNLYWRTDGPVTTWKGMSLDQWQREGHDQGSREADPMLRDPKALDFTLKPNSPALAMGFRSIDLSTIGPRS